MSKLNSRQPRQNISASIPFRYWERAELPSVSRRPRPLEAARGVRCAALMLMVQLEQHHTSRTLLHASTVGT
eukprot:3315740-Pleurochrysis_carterae.AAC.1